MTSTRNIPLVIPITTLVGVIESDIQFVEDGRRRPRCWFTLKTKQQDLFFVQAFEEKIELCRTLEQGDPIMAITLPRSFVYNRCGKHHVYFELVNFSPGVAITLNGKKASKLAGLFSFTRSDKKWHQLEFIHINQAVVGQFK